MSKVINIDACPRPTTGGSWSELDYCAVVTEDGAVYTFGSGACGKLGARHYNRAIIYNLKFTGLTHTLGQL